MKKTVCLLLALVMALSLLTACSGSVQPEEPVQSPAEAFEAPAEPEAEPEPSEAVEAEPEEPAEPAAEEPEASEPADAAPAAMEIEAEDANLFNTPENPVPLGQWVVYSAPNYTSDVYEPFYVRVTGVSRDQAVVQAALDAYDGIMDLTLEEDQARDIEFGLIEYEVYFAPDYTAEDYGITIPSMSWSASPIDGGGFETDGGSVYIGVGTAYSTDDGPEEYPHPGDTVALSSIFTVLIDYDESEYVFHSTWYDGEIEAEFARDLYFALQ